MNANRLCVAVAVEESGFNQSPGELYGKPNWLYEML